MRNHKLLPFIIITGSLILAACASIGMPEGGPRDFTPPRVTKCTPSNQATGNQKKKITIAFDEYINIENASEKVVVSPPQKEMPEIRTAGKKINITLFDTLQANTTYTIDFADAIVDNNESNPMGFFTYSFSTGEQIDTMEVSGTLLESENLEPIKGMLVGLTNLLTDSAFTTTPLLRVARTNGSGRFTIKGIAPGKYRIFGLQDADGDFKFSQKSEKIAFDTLVIEPSFKPDFRADTTWIDSTHIDTIRQVPYTHFYPDNLVLKAFTEEFSNQHLLKTERTIPEWFTIYFTAPNDSMPQLQGLNFDTGKLTLERSLHADTLHYWIQDTTVAYMDTLKFTLRYQETDTLGLLAWRTDTLELTPKTSRKAQLKELAEKTEEWEKEQKKERRRRKEKYVEKPNPHLRKEVGMKMSPSGKISPVQNITFTFDEPITHLDSAALHFFIKKDTLWVEEPFLFLARENDMRSFTLYAEWQLKSQYKIEADSNAFTSILGKQSAPVRKTIDVMGEEEYSSLFIHLLMPDTGAVVQLLDRNDKVVRQVRAQNQRADFYYMKPGEYYLRLYIDRNGDGKWNTGNYASRLQAEEVFYFPKPMSLRAQWEVEQDWDVRGIALEKQKPAAITKQKPDVDKKKAQREKERRAAQQNGR